MKKQSAVRFFYSHAGFSYDPAKETKTQGRWRCARELAAAESEAKGFIEFEWSYDESPDISYMDAEQLQRYRTGEIEILQCVARWNGEIVAALGGIEFEWSYNSYKRVIEAELAIEALSHL